MSSKMRKMLNNVAVWDNYAPAMMECACANADDAHMNRIKVCLFDIPFVR